MQKYISATIEMIPMLDWLMGGTVSTDLYIRRVIYNGTVPFGAPRPETLFREEQEQIHALFKRVAPAIGMITLRIRPDYVHCSGRISVFTDSEFVLLKESMDKLIDFSWKLASTLVHYPKSRYRLMISMQPARV